MASGTLARVGSTEISTQEFQQSYQNQFDNLRRRLGGRITAEQARAFGFDQQVLSQLIGAAAIDNHAKELRLGLPEASVTEHLKRIRGSPVADGKFNKAALDGFLRQNGLTERGFVDIARKDDIRDQLTIALVDSVVRADCDARDPAQVSRGNAQDLVLHARPGEGAGGRRTRRRQAHGDLRGQQAPVRQPPNCASRSVLLLTRRRGQEVDRDQRRGHQGGLRPEP